MAFNPLHSLRKRQKGLMAVMVFVAMVTFILFSGASTGADFFGWLQQVFTGRSRTGAEVATVYGEQISAADLDRLRQQRALANDYMQLALQLAETAIAEKIKALGADGKKFPPADGDSEFSRLQAQREILSQRQQLSRFGGYFGSVTTDELLEFLLWRKQADRLGIQLSDADIGRERDLATIEPLSKLQKSMIEHQLTQRRGSEDFGAMLLRSLGDEFRVRLAKNAILGPDAPPPARTPQSPLDPTTPERIETSFTPHEFFEFYRKNRMEINVSVLPIAVRDLLSQVKDQPTEDELKAFFEKHKDREQQPFEATPGFKQPRRVQVEWVSSSPKDAPYPHVADVSLAVLEATMPLAFQDKLLTQYNMSKFRFGMPSWTEEQSGKALLPVYKVPDYQDASKLRLLGVTPAHSAILTAVIGGYQSGAIAQDLKDAGTWAEAETRIRKQFLASTLALAGIPNAAPMLTAVPALSVASRKHSGDQWAHVPPLSVVKRHLLNNLRESAANDLVRKNRETFSKELESRRTRPEEAKKYIAEAVKLYSFKTGGMTQPRDLNSLFEDPGMHPLRDPVQNVIRMIAGSQGMRDIDRMLLDDPKSRFPSQQLARELTRTFTPRGTFQSEPIYTYWSTSDKPAYVPKFAEVREQVAETWRMQKAQELAKAEAEKVAESVKKAGNDPQRTLVDGSPYSGKLFSLDRVTRLKPPEMFALPGRSPQYTPYQIPRTDIEFPTRDFIDKILELKKVGDVVVLHDLPKSAYYVVVARSERLEPMLDDFRMAYRLSNPTFGNRSDPLLIQFDRTRRAEQRNQVIDQLKVEAKFKNLNPKGDRPEEDLP